MRVRFDTAQPDMLVDNMQGMSLVVILVKDNGLC